MVEVRTYFLNQGKRLLFTSEPVIDLMILSCDSRPNEVVFFKVTNIEYDVVARSSPSICNGSMLGELGCWVDTSVTRMIQTGLEHSRVPGVKSYFNLGKLCKSKRIKLLLY